MSAREPILAKTSGPDAGTTPHFKHVSVPAYFTPSPSKRPGFHWCLLKGVCARCKYPVDLNALFEGTPWGFEEWKPVIVGIYTVVFTDWTAKEHDGRRLVLLTRWVGRDAWTRCRCARPLMTNALVFPPEKEPAK